MIIESYDYDEQSSLTSNKSPMSEESRTAPVSANTTRKPSARFTVFKINKANKNEENKNCDENVNENYFFAVRRMISVIVISCPCAFGLAVPSVVSICLKIGV